MKKHLILVLLAALMLFCACRRDGGEPTENTFLFYFRAQESDTDVLLGQRAELDPAQLTLAELLEAYLAAEPQEGALRAVPETWSLLSAQSEGASAIVQFGGPSALLSPIERSVAYTCLANTIFQLPDIERLRIFSPDDPEGVDFSPSSFLLHDTGMSEQLEELTLYFPGEQSRYLVPEKQTVAAMEESEKPAYILERLLTADRSCIPKGTTLLSIGVENGVCTVNLSSHFVSNLPKRFAAERMAVYSIVNSLTELDAIRTVDLYVSGAPLERLHYLSFGSGLTREEGILAPTSLSEMLDATLYPVCAENELLVALPCAITPSEDASTAEQVLQTLLAFESKDGIQSCIPQGTKLLSLKLESGVCVVDLTAEFLDNTSPAIAETLAVRSIVATMTALPEIKSVEILVEGIEPTYFQPYLSSVRTPAAFWFAE